MTTAEEMYRAFIDGVVKEYVGIVDPDAFNRIINSALLLWLGEKLPEIGGRTKRIDDLNKFLVRTDGLGDHNIISFSSDPANVFDLSPEYPDVFRFVSAKFKVENNNSSVSVEDGDEVWIRGELLRDFHVSDDPYQSSNRYRVLFRKKGSNIFVYPYNVLQAKKCILEYYRYPASIVYSDTPENIVDPETGKIQNREICDIAIRMYLERIKDQRYNSFVNEEKFKVK